MAGIRSIVPATAGFDSGRRPRILPPGSNGRRLSVEFVAGLRPDKVKGLPVTPGFVAGRDGRTLPKVPGRRLPLVPTVGLTPGIDNGLLMVPGFVMGRDGV